MCACVQSVWTRQAKRDRTKLWPSFPNGPVCSRGFAVGFLTGAFFLFPPFAWVRERARKSERTREWTKRKIESERERNRDTGGERNGCVCVCSFFTLSPSADCCCWLFPAKGLLLRRVHTYNLSFIRIVYPHNLLRCCCCTMISFWSVLWQTD